MARQKMADAARGRLAKAGEHAAAEVEASSAPTRKTAGLAYVEVPVEAVSRNVGNVRKDLGDLTELKASIEAVGVLQPPVVRPVRDEERTAHPEVYGEEVRYVIVMGERRFTAACEAGRTTVPVLVRPSADTDRETETMLVENLHRKGLTPGEEAKAYYDLTEVQNRSQREVAQVVGVTQAHVSRRLALLKLAPEALELVDTGRLGVDVAKDLAALPHGEQVDVLRQLAAYDPDAEAYDPEEIRDALRRAEVRRIRDEQQRESEEKARAMAEEAGARILTREQLHEEFGDDSSYRRHLHISDEAYEQVKTAGDLGAVIEHGRLHWYRLDVLPEPEEAEENVLPGLPAERPRDPQAEEAARWRRTKADMQIWVEANVAKKPRKGAMVDDFARHIVDTMGHDHGTQVQKWVKGKVGDPDAEFWQWKNQLVTEGSAAEVYTVAWLVLVASDMYGARNAVEGSPARVRTEQRLGEVRADDEEGEQA